MAGVEIRAPRSGDHEQWRQLFVAYAETGGLRLDPQRIARTWSWICDPGRATQCLVAERDGQLVGFVHFREVERPILGDLTGYVDDLYVSDAARGGGLGRRLMDAVMDHGRERGWAVVRWTTKQSNEAANRMYRSMARLAPVNLYVAELD